MGHRELREKIWTRFEEMIRDAYSNNCFYDLEEEYTWEDIANMCDQFKVIWNGYDYTKVEEEEQFANPREEVKG